MLAWFENDGSGNFAHRAISRSAPGAHSVYAIDMDGDKDLDITLACWSDGTVRWFENDGSENFSDHTIATGILETSSVYAIDMDRDGDMDVLADSAVDDSVYWFENDGSQGFSTHTVTTNADRAYAVSAADLDGDGDLDILSGSAYDDKVAWYENDGSQGFTTHVITASANYVSSVFAIDLDRDGDMDVLSTSGQDDKVAWYENFGPGPGGFRVKRAEVRVYRGIRTPTSYLDDRLSRSTSYSSPLIVIWALRFTSNTKAEIGMGTPVSNPIFRLGVRLGCPTRPTSPGNSGLVDSRSGAAPGRCWLTGILS